jgi:branched-chain amino acid transport system substrate-binding protein
MARSIRLPWRLTALCSVALLLFAACGEDEGPQATDKCKGVAIGFFGALTGDSANLGINERNGAKLAIDQFNEKNSACQIGFKQYDTAGSESQAPPLAQQAIQDRSVVALVGPPFSGESRTANPIFDQAGLPIITPSATNPKLSQNGWKIFHRAVGNDNDQGPAAAKYMLESLNAKEVAVLDDASEYGKGIGDIVRNRIKEGEGSVVVSDTIDPRATDFSATVNKIKAAAPDAVFFGGYYQAGGVLAKQLRDAGVTATFVGPDGVNDRGFIEAAGRAAEGAILLAPAAPIDKVEGGTQFQEAYKEAFNTDVGLYSVEAYDAANAILEAIAAGNTTREEINEYLNNELEYEGLSKTLKFDENGELAGEVVIYAYKVENGQIVGLEPINT